MQWNFTIANIAEAKRQIRAHGGARQAVDAYTACAGAEPAVAEILRRAAAPAPLIRVAARSAPKARRAAVSAPIAIPAGLTYEDLSTENCLVAAIALLSLRSAADVRSEIVAAALPGEVAFHDAAGPAGEGCDNLVWRRYLKSRGWQPCYRAAPDYRMASLPATCLLDTPGHAVAVIDGQFFGVNAHWDFEVIGVWTPPPTDCPWLAHG